MIGIYKSMFWFWHCVDHLTLQFDSLFLALLLGRKRRYNFKYPNNMANDPSSKILEVAQSTSLILWMGGALEL